MLVYLYKNHYAAMVSIHIDVLNIENGILFGFKSKV